MQELKLYSTRLPPDLILRMTALFKSKGLVAQHFVAEALRRYIKEEHPDFNLTTERRKEWE